MIAGIETQLNKSSGYYRRRQALSTLPNSSFVTVLPFIFIFLFRFQSSCRLSEYHTSCHSKLDSPTILIILVQLLHIFTSQMALTLGCRPLSTHSLAQISLLRILNAPCSFPGKHLSQLQLCIYLCDFSVCQTSL